MSLMDYSGTISLGENAWEPYRYRLFQIFFSLGEIDMSRKTPNLA